MIGRFTTPDTLVQFTFDPQSLNRFSYVLNNPLIFTDPSGHYIPEIGRGNHTTDESVQRDVTNRIESGRGFDEDNRNRNGSDSNNGRWKKNNYKEKLETAKLYVWAKSELAGIPRQNAPPPCTLQIGLTFTYGWFGPNGWLGPGTNKAFGIVMGNSWEHGVQFGLYATGALGGIVGNTADAGFEAIGSENNNIEDLGGFADSTGGSASTPTMGKLALGVEANKPLSPNTKTSYSLNATLGVGTAIEAHRFRSYTMVHKIF